MEMWAGPIVRYADRNSISIWLATSDAVHQVIGSLTTLRWPKGGTGFVEDELVGLPLDLTNKSDPWTSRTIRLGPRLHLTLVTFLPRSDHGAFPTGVPLAYRLSYGGAPQPPNDPTRPAPNDLLGFAGVELRYDRYPTPTVVLPDEARINILHGSCRKIHGHGDDGMFAADVAIAAAARDDSNAVQLTSRDADARPTRSARPTAFYLTGDQIYADDVAECVFERVRGDALALLGRDERIEYPRPGAPIGLISGLEYGRRAHALDGIFSSTAMKGHLLSFGEFAAMYLHAWGTASWRRFEAPKTPEGASVERFRRRLPQARRAMANVPCYMICDDHEITDDWNLTAQWHYRAHRVPLTHRCILNGLAAFALFQDWGNHPRHDPSARAAEDAWAQAVASWVSSEQRGGTVEAALLSRSFSFAAPQQPRVVHCDTRTQRDFSSEDLGTPAGLMSPGALERVLGSLKDAMRGHEPFAVLVSPVPLVGLPTVDDVQAYALATEGPFSKDVESWVANARTLYALKPKLLELAAKKTLIVLSGDVHYSYIATERFAHGDNWVRFVQFTSSALKNSPLEDDIGRSWQTVAGAALAAELPHGLDQLPAKRYVYMKPRAQELAKRIAELGRKAPKLSDAQRALLESPHGPVVTKKPLSGQIPDYIEDVRWVGSPGMLVANTARTFSLHSAVGQLVIENGTATMLLYRMLVDATAPTLIKADPISLSPA
ncbi:hypothetical protein BE11_16380 [Sorangium cellulosum]|nr:hypothetical protein BE11_16380 [Sorangium cellulosum]